jgi:hypothetical protein
MPAPQSEGMTSHLRCVPWRVAAAALAYGCSEALALLLCKLRARTR